MASWELVIRAEALEDKDHGPCGEAGPFFGSLLFPGDPFLNLGRHLRGPSVT